MIYTVLSIGDDWIELWDGVSIVDPDTPRHRRTSQYYVGFEHGFQPGDEVTISIRKLVPTPEEVLGDELFQHGGEGALPS